MDKECCSNQFKPGTYKLTDKCLDCGYYCTSHNYPMQDTKQLEDIVVSLDLARELKENGYPQESLFYWLHIRGNEWELVDRKKAESINATFERVAAPTSQEIGEKLPEFYFTCAFMEGKKHKWWAGFMVEDGGAIHQQKVPYQDTEENARAKMWLYLKEKGLL